MMYNKDLKMEYINYITPGNKTSEIDHLRIFENTSKIEKELDKDISKFTAKEITELYKRLYTCSMNRIINYNSKLSRYTEFCMQKGLLTDGQNHFLEIDREIMKSCLNSLYLEVSIYTRDEILESISNLQNSIDKFLVLGCFEGIRIKEMFELKTSQFKNGKVILSSGRELEVSDELYKLAIDSSLETSYTPYLKVTDGSKAKNFDYEYIAGDPELIFKRMYNQSDNDTAENFFFRMNRKLKLMKDSVCTDIEYTSNDLIKSGRLYMINQFIIEDNNNDVKEVIINHKDEICYRYGKFPSIKAYVEQYKDFFVEV